MSPLNKMNLFGDNSQTQPQLVIPKRHYEGALRYIGEARDFDFSSNGYKGKLSQTLINYLQCGVNLFNTGIMLVRDGYDYVSINVKDLQDFLEEITYLIGDLNDNMDDESLAQTIMKEHFDSIDKLYELMEYNKVCY